MSMLRFENVNSVLCLGAHADDIEIGAGGALARLLAERAEPQVTWVVFSAAGERKEEAGASAERYLGPRGGQSRFLTCSFRDGYFPFEGAAIKDRFRELAGECSPDLVFTHRLEDAHQDHRLLAELTWQTFRAATILEYEIPKYEGDLGRPNLYLPLDESVCREKVARLTECFPSQADKPWFREETFWSLLRLRGVECRSPSGLAEAFTCRKGVLKL
jgi:LmbE family N-acetylglucosaminyl deacetylase